MMKLFSFSSLVLAWVAVCGPASAQNLTTYYNPMLSGWHSDPSCILVDDTFFCAASTFIAFPGLPIYASKDLVNWRLASHGWSRESQLPDGISWNTEGQDRGMYAPTLRHHEGEFWLVCEYLDEATGITGVLFRTEDPFDDDAWSDPLIFYPQAIDPDLFWDDDGTLWVATQGIILQSLDLETGELSQPPITLWEGTGGVWPEGPHIYKRDGYYYLLIAEGGTERDHAITIARATELTGPYEAYENNPILTNRGTDEYFQTVGHGDLFQDLDGNWWCTALSTRVGPDFRYFPMGRETVLTPARWDEGEWPSITPVRGEMSGPLPATNLDVPGNGPWNKGDDEVDFSADAPIPPHFLYWRVPAEGAFTPTDDGLKIVPSRSNLTGSYNADDDIALTGRRGLSFVGRRQAHTLFNFTADLSFPATTPGAEAGVSIFLTQMEHIDLSLVIQESGANTLRLRSMGKTRLHEEVPVPESWEADGALRFQIQAVDPTLYTFSVAPADSPEDVVEVGSASSDIVSGGAGQFSGSLVGVFASCDGAGEGTSCPSGNDAVFSRWRFYGEAQYITETDAVSV